MALPKPQLNGDVLAYDENQTDEINRIDDYVVERGVGERAEYTKYESGRISIKQISRMSTNAQLIDLAFPILAGTSVKTRFCYAQVHDYDVTNTKNVLSSYFDGVKIRVGATGITSQTDIFISVDAWWK